MGVGVGGVATGTAAGLAQIDSARAQQGGVMLGLA